MNTRLTEKAAKVMRLIMANEDVAKMEYVLKKDLDPNSLYWDTVFPYGTPLLHIAASYSFIEGIDLLIKYGANVNSVIDGNISAIQYAEHPEAIKTLVLYGADIDLKDDDGNTALRNAVLEGINFECIEALILLGADVGEIEDLIESENFRGTEINKVIKTAQENAKQSQTDLVTSVSSSDSKIFSRIRRK